MFKRICALVLCVAMLFAVSCGDNTKSADLVKYTKDGKTLSSIDEGFAYFLVSVYKSMYKSVAASRDEGWNSILDEQNGTTLGDILIEQVVATSKSLVMTEYLHDKEFSLKLSDEQKDSVKQQVESLHSMYGGKEGFETALSSFGATSKTIEKYFELMIKENNLMDYLYGENGKRVITEEAKKEYFEKNYVIVDDILFSTQGTTKDDGTVVSMPRAEVDALHEKVLEIHDSIVNGEKDYYEIKELYNEDKDAAKYYPKGFFVTDDDTFPADFVDTAKRLEDGQIGFVKLASSGFHIVKRLPMDASLYNAYEDVYMNISNAMQKSDYASLKALYEKNISVNEQGFKKFDVSKIPEFYA